MKSKKKLEKEIKIPEGVEISLDGFIFNVKGVKGLMKKKLYHPRIGIDIKDNKIILKPKDKKQSKKDKTLIGSFKSHINNMIKGVMVGFEYKLKICSGHFPMSVSIEKDYVVIKNFLGEKVPRKSRIMNGAEVKVQGDIISVNGLDKEIVSQTAAKIEQATRITNRDRRVFQDGCFIISKAGR